MYLLKNENLDAVLKLWADSFQVYAPIKQEGEVQLLPYGEGSLVKNYRNFSMPFKKYLFGQKEVLFRWEKEDGTIKTIPNDTTNYSKRVYFGLRPCDAYSIPYLDLFFYERYKDDNYVQKRVKAYIVALNCIQPGDNCFCSSMGTGPFASSGYDLLFTPINDKYLVESAGEKGDELISIAKDYLEKADDNISEKKQEVLEKVIKKFTRKLNTENLHEVMNETFNSDIWKELSKNCIGCTGCTNVCPTCTCFNVVDEMTGTFNKDGECSGCRVRYWDSCQNSSFTRNAGNHNPRNEVSRFRYRIYDKLKYIEERFGYKGCTGCGRCIDACPTFIDIIDIADRLHEEYEKGIRNKGEEDRSYTFERDLNEHNCTGKCEDIYTPKVAIIKDIIQETKDIKRFIVQYEDKSLHEKIKYTGQFFKITIFGVGEIAISIPFGDFKSDTFEFYVKKAGKVTTVLHKMKVGEKVGLRGPFGKGFPDEEIRGRDIIIVGSGVGLAPVRNPIEKILSQREEFGRVVIIASGGSYENLIYKDDLIEWGKTCGVDVLYAIGAPTDKVNAHVGRINDLLPNLNLNWKNTTAIICASPNRIKAVASDLLSLGMKGTDILTSLETHMRCGIGKCGHCKVGSKYMCVDGPVFNYEEMLTLPPEF
jgi:NAD(P)H-flavin reductase/ferredoxin